MLEFGNLVEIIFMKLKSFLEVRTIFMKLESFREVETDFTKSIYFRQVETNFMKSKSKLKISGVKWKTMLHVEIRARLSSKLTRTEFCPLRTNLFRLWTPSRFCLAFGFWFSIGEPLEKSCMEVRLEHLFSMDERRAANIEG